MEIFNAIAAKSCYEDKNKSLSFKTHASDTAGIIEKLYQNWLSENIKNYLTEQLNLSCVFEKADRLNCNFCRLIALLHDIGKLTPAFQSKIAQNIENYTSMLSDNGLDISHITQSKKSPHALAGQVILEKCGFPKEISIVIGSHHGKSQSVDYEKQLTEYRENYFGCDGKQEQQWHNLWNKWIDYALHETGFSVETLPKPDVKVQMILTGLLIMADWISSNTDYFPYDEKEETARINHAWNRLGLPDKWETEQNYDFKKRFQYIPNAVQETMMQITEENLQAGIYILEAPMGVGKTEAALAAAEILAGKFGFSGIYFGLPTQATANGIFGRIRNWAETSDDQKHAIRLAHGMIELNDEYQTLFHGTASDSGDENIIIHDWFEGRKQALLADFVVGTVDHFLLASLKQKHVMLRHLGLSGKVVIIDECHAYDAYMNIYLDNTLKWMGAYHVPVIILSATLPPKRRQELIQAYLNKRKLPEISQPCREFAYPVLTWTSDKIIMQKEIPTGEKAEQISVIRIAETDITDLLSEKLSNGGCAAVIVNTVKQAQQLYQELSEILSDEFEIICFHSCFISADRAEIEKDILEKTGRNSDPEIRNKLIVVGTQVLEQSLDIDFDYMITELCPMDLLLQRSGRLHRHNRTRPEKLKSAELAVFYHEKNKSFVYSEWILQQTEKFLPDCLTIPDCIPELVSKVYAEPENKENQSYQNYKNEIKKKENNAEKYCINASKLKSKRENTLDFFLNNDVGNSEQAEASVRDIKETVEVLVLLKVSEYQYGLVSKEFAFDITHTPNEDEAKQIARQRLRLPAYLSCNFDKLKVQLDIMPKQWRFSKWLDREWLLLLDENFETELLGQKWKYDSHYGLIKNEQ